MTIRRLYPVTFILLVSATIALLVISSNKLEHIKKFTSSSIPAHINPDYSDITIPPNIACLNFVIEEEGTQYQVQISGRAGNSFAVSSPNGKIRMSLSKWALLLDANKGGQICFEIYVKKPYIGWVKYPTIINTVAKENIDPYLVFRLTGPIFNFWHTIAICQRNLTSFKNRFILHGGSFENGCLNCHTFLNNSPEKITIAIRSKQVGNSTIMVTDRKVEKINSKWSYTAWHPSGKLAAYSINNVDQFFHINRIEERDVIDLDSAILYYLVDKQQTKSIPSLTQKDLLETYPSWSPDGKYLYYCCAPILWQDRDKFPPENWEKVKYSLKRISYNIDTDSWGQPETILSAEQTGLSILLPRISPDGRFLLFCMCEYSCFPVYQPSSDLYMMDLGTGQYKKLDTANSNYAESWHSWSSNSRWIAFSSKRLGGLFTRTYFSYVDSNGDVSKPFILPQKDPQYYDSLTKVYSVPELITAPVKVSPWELAKAIRSSDKIETAMPITGATTKGDTSDLYKQFDN
jgi:hypothetical protein